ncbi:MAG: type IV pilus assembly protein PilM [Phycisphaerae bacterium]|jgi:type IV pilus assembly protein PilM|nr:type IV pilus assembly protein PilM [Phycisphaerae bacterium]
MARAKSVWGVDIGQCALKALKLSNEGGQFQVEAFEVIEHPEHLRGPEVDRSEVFTHALGQFLAKNDVSSSEVAVAVPGQSSFMRFVKLPPVEPKRIPSIVRFEAEQQIPFPIGEIVWRWQTFHDPDSPDVEVGIFAMKRIEVSEMLAMMAFANLKVDLVQMAPLALYNFMCTDGQLAPEGATLLADVGTDKTDLVVADGPRIWTRTIQIGGNNFTEALVRAFKLSFGKAESLKRTAATSKYARQVFQAMRPVFADLVQEIQRSIGYYTSLHRESRFKRVLGLGNGFRLPGLQKFLEQNLNIPVVKIDSFNAPVLAPSLSEPQFTENILSFGVAYGLAIQGLSDAKVATNLLPDEVVRKRLWDRKRSWFAAAAAALLVVMCCWLYRGFADRLPYPDPVSPDSDIGRTLDTVERLEELQEKFGNIGEGKKEIAQMRAVMASYGYRKFWPSMLAVFSESIDSVATDNAKYGQCARDRAEVTLLEKKLARGSVPGKALSAVGKKDIEKRLTDAQARIDKFNDVDRVLRKIIVMENFTGEYSGDAVTQFPKDGISKPSPTGQRRGFVITTQFRTTVKDNTYIQRFIKKCRTLAEKKYPNLWIYGGYMTDKSVQGQGAAAAAAPGDPAPKPDGEVEVKAKARGLIDPITGKDSSGDLRVVVRWVVLVENDGIKYPNVLDDKPDKKKPRR